jgi:hypothetical protein
MTNSFKPVLIGNIGNELSNTNKKIVIYKDQYNINLNDYNHDEYDLKIYWQVESKGVIQKKQTNISFPIVNKNSFDLILASDPEILENCENSVLFPFGSCWINYEDQNIYEKTKLISIISSAKRNLIGHQLRHDVMSSIGSKMDIYGGCCKHVINKVEALREYKFSVCIENLQTPNWFTEKLIDCLRTGTIPIYWGCPNIGDYFNTKGFIIVNTLEEIINVVNNLTDDDYTSRINYIKENFELADFYGNRLSERLDNEIKKIIK